MLSPGVRPSPRRVEAIKTGMTRAPTFSAAIEAAEALIRVSGADMQPAVSAASATDSDRATKDGRGAFGKDTAGFLGAKKGMAECEWPRKTFQKINCRENRRTNGAEPKP